MLTEMNQIGTFELTEEEKDAVRVVMLELPILQYAIYEKKVELVLERAKEQGVESPTLMTLVFEYVLGSQVRS